MGEGQAIQGIIGGILAIVGILLAISGGDLWGRKPKWSIGLGLALSGVGLFMLITSFPQYAIGFSVLATLALAFAAFLTIKEADAREQRHRNNELLKEKRDKDERLLNEIIEWAINITECGTEKEITPMSQIEGDAMIRQFVLARATELELSFARLKGRSQYIHCIVPISEQDLQKIVDNLIKELEVHIDLFTRTRGAILYKPGTKENIEARDMMSRKVRDHKLELDKYANEVIKEATKIQTKDIS